MVKGDQFGFIRAKPAPKAVEWDQTISLEQQKLQFHQTLLIHKAHVIMLAEQEILTPEETMKILQALSALEKQAQEDSDLFSYMSSEAYVIEQAGDAGGKMHIGRSRNDLKATSERMYFRDRVNDLIESLLNLRRAFLETAEKHTTTIMPGYTHWQQAQPVTAGHYLVAHADACERCVLRLENAYDFINKNPLGAAAFAGTGWNLNRDRTTALLGFTGLLENTWDAIATRDFLFDIGSALTMLMSNLSRLAEDLQIWASIEFSGVDFPAEYAGTSSIMPQKKNPSFLEVVRGLSAQIIGGLTSIIVSMKGTAYTNLMDHFESFLVLDRMMNRTTWCLELLTGIISKLDFKKELLLKRSTEGFSTMTDLADALVRVDNISFRNSHEIVAEAVITALNTGKSGNEITKSMLDAAAQKIIGQSLKISADELRTTLDPVASVQRRTGKGEPAPEEVTRMITDRFAKISKEQERLQQRRSHLESSYKKLEERVQAFL